jgi:hypothetical protein
MTERRKAQRHKTYKAARIAFDDRRAVINCLVKNLSDAGACIAVESPVGIPDTFNLVFDSSEPVRSCHVIWRTAKQIGVEFQQAR